jgi:SAM-dependent methyltransferase
VRAAGNSKYGVVVSIAAGAMSDNAYAYVDTPRSEMVEFVPPGTRNLLDVGCGRGGFGRSLKERVPVSITGIEVDPGAVATAEQRYDRVITGVFPDDVPPGLRFDCIVFNDILEHLVDPWEALRAARRILEPGGAVVASIPNMRYWPVFWRLVTKGEWRYVDDGTLDRTHLRFFTLSSIREMFETSGFVSAFTTPINLVEFDQLDPPSARVLKVICRVRKDLGIDFRAQQYAVVAPMVA